MLPLNLILYISGAGSGGAYRALAIQKAIIATGHITELKLICIGHSDYPHLLKAWGIEFHELFRNSLVPPGPSEFLCALNQPFIFLSNYNPREFQNALRIGSPLHNADLCRGKYLLLRRTNNIQRLLEYTINLDFWDKIITIEPEVLDFGQLPPIHKAKFFKVTPVLATRKEEVVGYREAREALINFAKATTPVDPGMPVSVLMNNSQKGYWELEGVCDVDVGFRLANHLLFSQCAYEEWVGVVVNTTETLAKYFQGIDYLTALPGYNTFWEWYAYSRNEATVADWLLDSMPEPPGEPSHSRVTNPGISREELLAGPNGADQIIQLITSGVKLRPFRGSGVVTFNP